MNFLLAAALAVGLLVGVPLAAHLLRRGRAEEREFPAAALVPAVVPVARQRRRLEDRALLALRAGIVLALALLGATPLVRCARLELGRTGGASLAVAVVVDDSLSMQAALPEGDSRFERARAAALELVDGLRPGDAVSVVLAGRPARLLVAASTDAEGARRALTELRPSDRATDLHGALSLAESALARLPHVDRRVVLLSDLAGELPPPGRLTPWLPLPELATPLADCGITTAAQRERAVTVEVVCSTAAAAQGRVVRLVRAGTTEEASPATTLPGVAGAQQLELAAPSGALELDALLGGTDPLPGDDRAPVVSGGGTLVVAVVSDGAHREVATGGAGLVEQAIRALGDQQRLRPLPLVPDEPRALEGAAALVLDDPEGLTPEQRAAVTRWVEEGGVALALLGPAVDTVRLGSTLEPFVVGAPRWEATASPGAAAEAELLLGTEGRSLSQLGARQRVALEPALAPGSQVRLRWSDGAPLLVERALGRGVAMALALPASVEHSELALRPAFLALIDRALTQARERSGAVATPVGQPWRFPATTELHAEGPGGPAPLLRDAGAVLITPDRAGRHRVTAGERLDLRVAHVEAAEILATPAAATAGAVKVAAPEAAPLDVSREVALVLLGLLGVELALRAWLRRPSRRGRRLDDEAGARTEPA